MSTWVLVGTIPGVSTGGAAFTDAFTLGFKFDEAAIMSPVDVSTFEIALQLEDTNDTQTESITLGISGPLFSDSNVIPSDSQSFTLRNWLSGSVQSTGVVTDPANADGQNNGTVATLTTALLGSNPTMTSICGATLPNAVLVSAVYRGWFNANITVLTSRCIITARSTTAAFADFDMFNVDTSINHMGGTFTVDLIAAGVNTLAKLQSLQILHKTTDLVAGVTPAIFTVDAGCIELAAAF